MERTASETSWTDLRVASYNVRVDHTDDVGTKHDWIHRRPLVVAAIRALAADLVGLQEPGPKQAEDLKQDLGDSWSIAVTACDPKAWEAAGEAGPSDGQARDGNGFAWRSTRLELLGEIETFWLSDNPSAPHPEVKDGGRGPWGGSKYQRTCVVGNFRDKVMGLNLTAFSAHFDHAHDDDPRKGYETAPCRSAQLVAERAKEVLRLAKESKGAGQICILMGDFNTFLDRQGACYETLGKAVNDCFQDVRDVPGCIEIDAGRKDSSWEGWEHTSFARCKKGDQRYDQMFIGASNCLWKVHQTCVPEARFNITADGNQVAVYASDHLPIIADIAYAPVS